MTSTEFAAKYRLLKNVATRGARSFLAQQVQLGRMVMVHYLDSESIEQRAATLARLDGLRPPARDKLLEIADVDGTPVAVTLFISSFKDFATWLDSLPQSAPAAPPQRIVPVPSAPGEFTREFNRMEPAASPLISAGSARSAEPSRKQDAPKKTASEFTRIFGKLDEPGPADLPDNASAAPANRDENTVPTIPMEAVRSPHTPPAVRSNGPSSAAPDSGSGFTAIFGSRREAAHGAPDLSFANPVGTPSPRQVMPPSPPAPDPRPATPSPVPQPAAPNQPGEFTQLFQRLSSDSGAPSAPFAAAPLASELQRPIAPTPRADAPPPLPSAPSLGAPALGSSPGAPLAGSASGGITPPSMAPLGAAALSGGIGAVLPPASLTDTPAAPANRPKPSDLNPSLPNLGGLPNAAPVLPATFGGGSPPPAWGAHAPIPAAPAIGASMFGSAPPSEFTRIMSPIAAPPPPVAIQPPTSAAAPAPGSSRKSMLPLIIGLAAVVVLTVVIVLYFVLRK